jgi:GxxExxY protein
VPIISRRQLNPFGRHDFGPIAYKLFGDVLAIREQLGRFFEEKHYRQALALRRNDVLLEEPIVVSHGTFKKEYFLDMLVGLGGIVEFKAAEAISPRHRSQLMNYLMLSGLSHGMLINVRPEKVTHEFVNNAMTYADRLRFESVLQSGQSLRQEFERFSSTLLDLLRDWGTCLDLTLYEDALTQLFGGDEQVIRPVAVSIDGQWIGSQRLRFVGERTAFKLTALEGDDGRIRFEHHARKLVEHTDIAGLLWANIARHEVTIRSLAK